MKRLYRVLVDDQSPERTCKFVDPKTGACVRCWLNQERVCDDACVSFTSSYSGIGDCYNAVCLALTRYGFNGVFGRYEIEQEGEEER